MLNFSKILYPFLLFIFSVYVNNYYGSIGVFPVDSFAFFDSAYSINHGMIPFRDYWVMNGPIIDLIQSDQRYKMNGPDKLKITISIELVEDRVMFVRNILKDLISKKN